MSEEKPVSRLQSIRTALARYITDPIINLLAKTPITPNTLTVCSLVITIGAGILIAMGQMMAGGFVVLFAAFFDTLDGALARRTNRVTRFGAALDSSFDRMAEAIVFIGLIFFYGQEQSVAGVVLAAAALTSSLMVSYVRARAEGLGLDCRVGIFTRPERIIVMVIGLLLSQFSYVLSAALIIITVFASVTVSQRLYHIWQKTKTQA